MHARFAMLGLPGMLVPELLTNSGSTGLEWFNAGAAPMWTSTGSLLGMQFLLMGWVEVRRYLVSTVQEQLPVRSSCC